MIRLTGIFKKISRLTFYWKAIGRLSTLWEANEYENLISFCNLMLSKFPTDYFAFYYRGLAHEKLNELDLAIEDFNTSERFLFTAQRQSFLKEYFTKIPIHMSKVYRKKQDLEKALEYADRAVQADNKETVGLIWRASLKKDMEDLFGASEDLNEALRRKPSDKKLKKMRDVLTYHIIQEQRRVPDGQN